MDIFAYLDAGTGSLILQAVIGGLVGIGVIVKAFWGRIVGVFKRNGSDEADKKISADKTAATAKTTKSTK